MRRLLTLLVATVSLTASASAQRSGLLLGFSVRTLWIAPVEGKMRVAAEVPALIVPRDDGFHHLGVARYCGITEHGEGDEGGPYSDQIDVVLDLKLGSPLPAPGSQPNMMSCDSAAAVLKAHADSVARADSALSAALASARTAADSMDVRNANEGEDICGFDYVRITYASPHFYAISESEGTTEFCNPGRYTTSGHRRVFRAASSTEVGLLR